MYPDIMSDFWSKHYTVATAISTWIPFPVVNTIKYGTVGILVVIWDNICMMDLAMPHIYQPNY